MTAPARRDSRCAAHPGRPAVDACPVCSRDRCGADAASWAARGCEVCQGGPSGPSYPPAGDRERLVRAALAAHVAAFVGGYVAGEYVQAEVFAYAAPAVVGVGVAAAALAAAKAPTGAVARQVRVVATVYALLSVALGFVQEGTFDVFSGSRHVLVPYLIAVAAAWLWAAPPPARKKPEVTA